MSVKTEMMYLSRNEKFKVFLLLGIIIIAGVITSGFSPSWGMCYAENPSGGISKCVWNLFTVAEAVAFVPGFDASKTTDVSPNLLLGNDASSIPGNLKLDLGFSSLDCGLGKVTASGIGDGTSVMISILPSDGSAPRDVDAKQIYNGKAVFVVGQASPGDTILASAGSAQANAQFTQAMLTACENGNGEETDETDLRSGNPSGGGRSRGGGSSGSGGDSGGSGGGSGGSVPQCRDGIDNDNDGKIDTRDTDCYGTDGLYYADDNSESSGSTTSGVKECNDGIDNDGDGYVDYGTAVSLSTGYGAGVSPITGLAFADISGMQTLSPQTGSTGSVLMYSPKYCGDVNLNGKIDANDAQLVGQYVAGLVLIDDIKCVDVNGDGNVNVLDAQKIASSLSGSAKLSCVNCPLLQTSISIAPIPYNPPISTGTFAQITKKKCDLLAQQPMSLTNSLAFKKCKAFLGSLSANKKVNPAIVSLAFKPDAQCSSANDDSEASECSDGIDNDNDGKIDYPSDRGCLGKQDDNEVDNTISGPGTNRTGVCSIAGDINGDRILSNLDLTAFDTFVANPTACSTLQYSCANVVDNVNPAILNSADRTALANWIDCLSRPSQCNTALLRQLEFHNPSTNCPTITTGTPTGQIPCTTNSQCPQRPGCGSMLPAICMADGFCDTSVAGCLAQNCPQISPPAPQTGCTYTPITNPTTGCVTGYNTVCNPTSTPQCAGQMGDINGDGKTDVRDAQLIASKVSSSTVPTNANQKCCYDLNRDGQVNNQDAIFAAQIGAGLQTVPTSCSVVRQPSVCTAPIGTPIPPVPPTPPTPSTPPPAQGQTCSLVAGDLNNDGVITHADYTTWVALWSANMNAGACTTCKFAHADVNGDGILNRADVDLFYSFYNSVYVGIQYTGTPLQYHNPVTSCSITKTQCNDGLDNEGDTFVDANDMQCKTSSGVYDSTRNSESATVTMPTTPTTPPPPIVCSKCSNNIDDDGNGDIDSADPQCLINGVYSAGVDSEGTPLPPTPPQPPGLQPGQCRVNADCTASNFACPSGTTLASTCIGAVTSGSTSTLGTCRQYTQADCGPSFCAIPVDFTLTDVRGALSGPNCYPGSQGCYFEYNFLPGAICCGSPRTTSIVEFRNTRSGERQSFVPNSDGSLRVRNFFAQTQPGDTFDLYPPVC